MALVFFDVDGTLLSGTSSERRFAWYLARAGTLRWRQYRAFLDFFLKHGMRFGRSTPQRNKAWLCGLECVYVAEIAQRFVRRDLAQSAFDPAIDRLTKHQTDGERVVLLTGMPDFLAAPLATALGVTDWIATQCQNDGQRFLAGVPGVHPYGMDKLHLAGAFCAASGHSLSAATAYANDWSDRFLLEAVARPIAVRPDRRLRRFAGDAGWEMLGPAPVSGESRRGRETPQSGL